MYKIFKNILGTTIVKTEGDSQTWIPVEPSNHEYKQYLQWLEEGNEPEPWEPSKGNN